MIAVKPQVKGHYGMGVPKIETLVPTKMKCETALGFYLTTQLL